MQKENHQVKGIVSSDVLITACVVSLTWAQTYPWPAMYTYMFSSFGCGEDDCQDADELKDGTQKQPIAQQAL